MLLLVQYTLTFASVLILVALGGCFSEHSGVINLGLEGVMIMGALGGALVMRYLSPTVPAIVMILAVVLISMLFGVIYSALLAVACINFKADQTITGTAMNMLATAAATVAVKAMNTAASGGNDVSSDISYTRTKDLLLVHVGGFELNWFMLVAVLCLITGGMGELVPAQLVATALVCVGVVGLGIVEAHEDEDLRRKRQEAANRRYAKSALALLLPIIYCILDAAGTFADSRVLDKLSARALAEGMFATADECSDYAASAANCAYELTFLLAGIVCFVYVVLIRKQKLIARQEAPKYAGAAFETAGQFAYIFALSDTAHVAISAPIISAYCVASVVWSRIFLKEKLSLKHYLMIALVVAGIVILGVYDG